MSYDCIIVGAGHNGLVCATLLGRAGKKVLVVEAAEQVGGAAVTREFHPGFRVSSGAHLFYAMPGSLLRDLKLEQYGLQWAARAMPTTALQLEKSPLSLGNGAGASAEALALVNYHAKLQRFAKAFAPMLAAIPPRLGTVEWSDRLKLLKLAWQVRKLGRHDMREFLRIIGMNVYDLLQENFSSPAIKGALAFDAVLGTNFGPRSPGSVLTLLHRMAGLHATGRNAIAQPQGGMGAVSDALAKAAQGAGVSIRTGATVQKILVDQDRTSGVQLHSGEKIVARSVISNADPKTTFLTLLGAQHLDTGFVRRVQHIRIQGLAAKIHLALTQEPRFTGLPAEKLAGRLIISPTMEYLEKAFNHSKYGEYSTAPALEITVPTLNDPALASRGHVLSAIVQYAPYTLKGGWETQRQHFTEIVINTLECFAPGIRKSIVAAELLTPVDIEREFRMRCGHWHHGELAFDQFMMVRPVPGAGQYRTPMPGLFLCGAGTHPGGGVAGIAGRNAALQVLAEHP